MANDNHGSQDAPTGLPAGWVWTTFGEVFDIQGGSQPDKGNFIYEPLEGYVRLLQIRDFGNSPVPTYVPREMVTKFCKRDDIFVARYGASLGRILTGMDGAYNVALAKVIFDDSVIANKYVFYLLQTSYFQTPIHMISRSAQNGFNKGDLFPIKIPLAPLSEQHRIVAKIEEQFTRLDAGVAALKRAQANLKRYKAAVLKAACEGKLVAQDASDEPASELLKRILAERRTKWEADLCAKGKDPQKAKYEKPNAPGIDELPELPQGWCWATIDQLISMLQYGTSVKADAEAKTGVPVIRMGNIQEGQLDFSNLKFIDPDKEDISKYSLTQGDILINRTNSPELVGKAGLFARNGVFVFASYLIRLRVDPNFFLPQYLVTCLNSEIGRRHVVKVKHQVAGQANINSQDIRTMPIPLPPLAEQRRIVAEVERRLSVVQELEATLAANLARAKRLRQSILKQAFEGKLVGQVEEKETPQYS